MVDYYGEVEHLIKKYEVNKKARIYEENNNLVITYWNIGRLIVEAQGGVLRAKYGNKLLKEWSSKLVSLYGKGYGSSNLKRFRQFYMIFSKRPPVGAISWSHYRELLPIKDENKRNYYVNLCITNNLSVRELISEIKNNAYERLLEKPERIEIIGSNEEEYNIREHLKNPIIIKLNKNEKLLKEKELQMKILAKLKNFLGELGAGFTLVGNEYKIKYGNKIYYIDLLLFNYNINSFVVVELKLRELKKEDKAQVEFYMNLVDNTLKKKFHDKTKGIIISKYQDSFIVSFVSGEDIIPITYSLVE